jgi:hypothetical protein
VVPESILIYREYDALMNDARAQVVISLARIWGNEEAMAAAGARGVVLCRHIRVSDFALRCAGLMTWTFDGREISIVAGDTAPAILPAELRMAIPAFVRHFIQAIVREIDAVGSVPPSMH